MLGKINPSQRFHKENKMRILVALIAVFMVSGARAQCPITDPLCLNQDCEHYAEPGGLPYGTSFMCKDPKTGKTQKVQCKKPPKQKLPPKIKRGELEKVCGYVTGDGSDQLQ